MPSKEDLQGLTNDLTNAHQSYGDDIFDSTKNGFIWEEFKCLPYLRIACKIVLSKGKYSEIQALVSDTEKSLVPGSDVDFAIFDADLNNVHTSYGDDIFDSSKNGFMWEEFYSSEELIGICKKILESKKYSSVDALFKAVSQEYTSSKLRSGKSSQYTRFEKARIIGARALQIAMGAPVLVDYPEDMLDPIDIAMLEFDAGILPISVVRA